MTVDVHEMYEEYRERMERGGKKTMREETAAHRGIAQLELIAWGQHELIGPNHVDFEKIIKQHRIDRGLNWAGLYNNIPEDEIVKLVLTYTVPLVDQFVRGKVPGNQH